MNIVIEGPDATGKSTLARFLSRGLSRPIISSEGREKFPGEINERIRRWGLFDGVIFDRHPCVSQIIYSTFNGTSSPDPDLVFDFYETRPAIIYCVSTAELRHITKGHDTPDHLEMVETNSKAIKELYDQWALDYAQFIYRPGMPMQRVLSSVISYI